jgi:two-component system chemotaxis response regulator CheY
MALILVVDDADFMRARTAKLLADAGHRVIQAGNGRAAIEQYERHRPDLVLMDIVMPELDGLAALRELRALDPEARVAMVSALSQQAIVVEAVRAGARDFLVKPCSSERLLDAVARLCAPAANERIGA